MSMDWRRERSGDGGACVFQCCVWGPAGSGTEVCTCSILSMLILRSAAGLSLFTLAHMSGIASGAGLEPPRSQALFSPPRRLLRLAAVPGYEQHRLNDLLLLSPEEPRNTNTHLVFFPGDIQVGLSMSYFLSSSLWAGLHSISTNTWKSSILVFMRRCVVKEHHHPPHRRLGTIATHYNTHCSFK